MRVRIQKQEFPSKNEWLKAFSNSLYLHTIEKALDIMYRTLQTNANTLGFSLVRYQFDECMITLQNQYPYGWILEIKC